MTLRTRTTHAMWGLLAAALALASVGTGAASAQAPWSAAVGLPGPIKAEEFDRGGQGVGYRDFDAANLGGAFRTGEGVDVETSPAGAGGGYNIGHIRPGEWLAYTVDVRAEGRYDLEVRWASGNQGGTGHFELNGRDVSGPIELGFTGGFQMYNTLRARNVLLPAGRGVLRFVVDSSAGPAEIGNVKAFAVRASVAPGAHRWPAAWQPAAPAPEARFEQAAKVVGGKIYIFGGFKELFGVHRSYVTYDPAANAWTPLGTLPAGMAETHLGIAADDRYVYFAGGFGGDLNTSKNPTQWISDKVWRYDTATNGWQEIAQLPAPRGAGGLALVGRKLHYFGGNPADRVTNVGDHWVFDLDARTWSGAAPMPDPKDHLSTEVLGGRIYAVGGEHGHDARHEQRATAHAYDIAANRWIELAELPTRKSHLEAATFVLDGKLVLAGGQVDNFQPTDEVVLYEPGANRWSELAPALPQLRQGSVVQPVGDRIVATLGAKHPSQPQSSTWVGGLPPLPAPGPGTGTGTAPVVTPPAPPTATACRATRSVVVRWRAPKGRRLRTVVVSVDGRKRATVRRSRTRGTIRTRLTVRLRGLPRPTTVTVRARDTAGRLLTARRTYRGCGTPTQKSVRLKAVKKRSARR